MKLFKFCQILRQEVNEAIPVQTVQVFLYIALFGEATSNDIQAGCGMTQSSVSRHCLALTDWRNGQKEGYGLIWETYDPMERRRKLYRLTKKGEKFLARLETMMADNRGKEEASA